MNRLYFSFEGSDEYFAKTTEIDDYDAAIITAIYPIIKNRKGIIDPPLKIEIGCQAPYDDVEYVVISNNENVIQISEIQSFKRGYTGFIDSTIERVFTENCAKVNYYGAIKELVEDMVFIDNSIKCATKKEASNYFTGVDKETQKILNTECPDETPKQFNDLSFNVMSDICDEIISTLKKKNDDYGNSYIKNIERFGKQAMLIPMFNKLDRLESLSKKENQNFESFEDSLRDLTGYCLMAIQHLIKTRGKWWAFGIK